MPRGKPRGQFPPRRDRRHGRLPRLIGIDVGRSHILRDILVWQAVAVVTAFAVTKISSRRIAGGLILASLILVPLAATSSNSPTGESITVCRTPVCSAVTAPIVIPIALISGKRVRPRQREGRGVDQ